MGSIIGHLGYLEWVVLATATAAAITSWVEFSDAARKAERYTRALYSLRKLLAWWASLGQVEKASRGDHPPRDDERGDHLGRAARVDVNIAHRKVGENFGRARFQAPRATREVWRCESEEAA